MRRFEFVEGNSAKFWMASVEGNVFTVVYGRLGTDGQRKEKEFKTPQDAQKEYDKKIAEKLREGYNEVAADAAKSAPTGAKGAAAASKKLELPPRVVARPATENDVKAAADALQKLAVTTKKSRSWQKSRDAHRAANALRRLGGVNAAEHKVLGDAFQKALSRVAATGAEHLSLRSALEILSAVDSAALPVVLASWQKSSKPHASAKFAADVLNDQREKLENDELALRVTLLLLERTGTGVDTEAAFKQTAKKLWPHLEAFLVREGSNLKKHFKDVVGKKDPWVAARLAALGLE